MLAEMTSAIRESVRIAVTWQTRTLAITREIEMTLETLKLIASFACGASCIIVPSIVIFVMLVRNAIPEPAGWEERSGLYHVK